MAIASFSTTVDYTELKESPQEELTYNQGLRARRILLCDWADRVALARDLLGYWEAGTLHKAHEYDYNVTDIQYNYVYAQRVTIEPIAKHEKAKLVVEYATRDYEDAYVGFTGGGGVETTYVSESLNPATEFLTLDRTLYWDNAQAEPVDASQAPGLLVNMTEWTYTIHGLNIPPAAVIDLPGKINNATTFSQALNYTFGAGTLLCGNPSMEREITSIGTTAWTVTFRFMYRPDGWNYVPKVDNAAHDITWQQLYDDSGTVIELYPSSDFGAIVA